MTMIMVFEALERHDEKLAELKRQKLHLKEEIERLRQQTSSPRPG